MSDLCAKMITKILAITEILLEISKYTAIEQLKDYILNITTEIG